MALGGTFILVRLKWRLIFTARVNFSGIGILDRKLTFYYGCLETSIAYLGSMKHFIHQNDVLCTKYTCVDVLR